jgi:hypothetical protein
MFDGHSERELLLALTMLVNRRRNEWALEAGRKMIGSLDSLIRSDGSWDLSGFPGRMAPSKPRAELERLASTDPTDLAYTNGRLIEAIVEFHEASGFDTAMDLARRLVKIHMAARPPAERVAAGLWIHHHSIFGTYRGIYRYGKAAGEADAVEYAVGRLEDEALPRLTESGFIPEADGAKSSGETSSPGDVAQLALWAATGRPWRDPSRDAERQGYPASTDAPELLDTVERIARACLLPSQIVCDPGIHRRQLPNREEGDPSTLGGAAPPDREKEYGPVELLRSRAVGAYGGVHAHPYGMKRPTTDVTAATLHSMCNFHSSSTRVSDELAAVDLHFDSQVDDVVVSVTGGEKRVITVTMENPRRTEIRLPGWGDREAVELTVDGEAARPGGDDGRIVVAASDLRNLSRRTGGRHQIVCTIPLPLRETLEKAAGIEHRLRWRGDEVIGIAPNAPYLAFYPDLEE